MDTLDSLTAELDALSRTAEQIVHAQPRPTRKRFTAATRSIFQRYRQHGNQARLRHNVKAFLETGDEGMTFAETPPQRSSAKSTVTPRYMQTTPKTTNGRESGGRGQGAAGEGRTVDAECTQLVAAPPDGLDFHLDRSFVLHADTKIPQDVFESMDRIFGLYAKEAKLLLSHHCEKYGNEAVFRAGVREFVMRWVYLFCCERWFRRRCAFANGGAGIVARTRCFRASVGTILALHQRRKSSCLVSTKGIRMSTWRRRGCWSGRPDWTKKPLSFTVSCSSTSARVRLQGAASEVREELRVRFLRTSC